MADKDRDSAKSPWDVDVDVYLDAVGPPPQFRVESYLMSPSSGNLAFHNRGRPGFTINFHLHDLTNSGYRFPSPPNITDAVWSCRGAWPGACPTSGVWDIFEPRAVTNHGEILTVYNENPSPPQDEFSYTLRVTNDDGATFVDLDPGGENNNGPRTFSR